MFKALKAWLAALIRAYEVNQFNDGYDWAAGQLLRGKTVDEIDARISNPWEDTQFDRGAEEALFLWEQLDTLAKRV